jgi:hypothetical protein
VSVNVVSPGAFFVEGILYDSGWGWVSTNGTWATLTAGTHIILLSFPGFMINTHGDDGVFYIYIELQDGNGYYLDDDYVTTSSFNHDEFDGTVPRIESGWADVGPTIDGVLDSSEWVTAVAIDLQTINPMNGLAGTLLVMNDGTNLYIAYDVFGDTTEDSGDACAIGFDTSNDDTLTDAREDQFVLRGWTWNTQSHFVYDTTWMSWATDCAPFDDMLTNHAGLAGAMGFGTSNGHALDHRVYELSVPLTLLGISPGQTIGFLGRSYVDDGIYDDHSGDGSSWPVMFTTQPPVTQYGEIHLATSSTTPAPTTSASMAGTSGSSGWYVSSVSVSLTATGGRGGVDYTEYSLNGGSWTNYTVPIQMTSDGTYTLEFRSVDNFAQIEATQTVTVKVDRVSPVATSEVSGQKVWLNGTDGLSGMGSIKYRVDNGTWTTYAGVLTIDVVGTHIVEFYAIDAAGNQQSTQSVTVVVKGSDKPASPTSFPLIWLGLIAAIVAALVIILLLAMKRRKGKEPMMMAPPPAGMMITQQMPPPPPMSPRQ